MLRKKNYKILLSN